jgi:hypothetical protein
MALRATSLSVNNVKGIPYILCIGVMARNVAPLFMNGVMLNDCLNAQANYGLNIKLGADGDRI